MTSWIGSMWGGGRSSLECADRRFHRPLPPDRGQRKPPELCGEAGRAGIGQSAVERLRPFGVVLDDLVAIEGSPKHGSVFGNGRVRVGDVQNPVREVCLTDAPLRGVPASEVWVVGCQLADGGFAFTFDEARKSRRACADVGESNSVVCACLRLPSREADTNPAW